MTEQQWNECREPREMLLAVRPQASPRRLRLFAVACGRIIEQSPDVEMAERYADGEGTAEELAGKWEFIAYTLFLLSRTSSDHGNAELWLSMAAADPDAWKAAVDATHPLKPYHGEYHHYEVSDPAVYCRLIRCLFGNPFRPPFTPDSTWLTRNDYALPKLATVIYDGRRWDEVLILADALEEAGCTDEAALAHLRGPGPHARGCFVVDALTGRE